jgi:hypothetical protein
MCPFERGTLPLLSKFMTLFEELTQWVVDLVRYKLKTI